MILTVLAATVATVAASTASRGASAAPVPAHGTSATGVSADGASAAAVSAAGPRVRVLAGPSASARTTVVDAGAVGRVATATFSVTYTGFTPEAQAAFQRAVDYWATQVTSSVPIRVDAGFSALAPGVLGANGPPQRSRNFPGAPLRNTWYVDAVADKHAGSRLNQTADMSIMINSTVSAWSYGPASAPSGTYDLQTVATQQLAHGLGFWGFGQISVGSHAGIRQLGSPASYDRLTERGSGRKLVSYAEGSGGMLAALLCGNLRIDTAAIRTANGGRPAKLWSPTTLAGWQTGTSYSHLDEAAFPRGSADSLMTPWIDSGETVRTAGPVTMAVLEGVGW